MLLYGNIFKEVKYGNLGGHDFEPFLPIQLQNMILIK